MPLIGVANAVLGGPLTFGTIEDGGAVHRAQVSGVERVEVLLLNAQGASLQRLQLVVEATGGQIIDTDAELGFLRAEMTLPAYAALQGRPEIAVMRLNGSVKPNGTWALAEQKFPRNLEPSLLEDRPLLDVRALSVDSPEVPVKFMGVDRLRQTCPACDGRGVIVAVLENLVPLDHPALSTALDRSGQPLPKVAAVVFDTTLAAEDEAPPQSREVIADEHGAFMVDERSYTAPVAGAFRFATRTVGSGWYVPSEHPWTVLWKAGERRAWVDANQNGNFKDEAPLGDFNLTGEIGELPNGYTQDAIEKGGKSTSKRLAGPLAFIVLFNPHTGEPLLFAGDNGHTTPVSGYAAGHSLDGGRAGSAAPNAQLFSALTGDSFAATLSSLLLALKDEGVDLVTSSTAAMDLEQREDLFGSALIGRAVRRAAKPVFWFAGNLQTFTESVYSPSVGTEVISVGGYIHRDTIKALAGYEVARTDWVMDYSRGPSRLGAMKPDLVAPSPGITAGTCAGGPGYHPAAAVSLPPCYIKFAGTSAATPMAASGAAALISGAKQKNLPHDAIRLKWALKAGARFLPDWPVHAQGAGLIQLPKAWRLLQKAAEFPEWRYAPQIEIDAPLTLRWTEIWDRGDRGNGLYEREGWRPGDRRSRQVTLTRHSGPPKSLTYDLAWLGNDGTFALKPTQTRTSLPLNQPITLTVDIHPRTLGAHSAALQLIDPELGEPVHWLMTTIVASQALDQKSDFVFRNESHRPFLAASHYFVDVPSGAAALRLDLDNGNGRVELRANAPLNVLPIRLGNASGHSGRGEALDAGKPGRMTAVIGAPTYGVWEFVGLEPGDPIEYKVEPHDNEHAFRVSALAASVQAKRSNAERIALQLHNKMAALESAAVHGEIGFRTDHRLHAVTAATLPPVTVFEVGEGTRTLRVSAVADDRTPLRIWLYDCSTDYKGEDKDPLRDHCKLFDGPLEPTKQWTVRRPAAGAWKVIVDRTGDWTSAPALTLSVIQTHTKYGNVSAKAAPSPRNSGEKWTEDAQVDLASVAVPEGSTRVALVELRDVGAEDAELKSFPAAKSHDDFPHHPVALGSAVVELD